VNSIFAFSKLLLPDIFARLVMRFVKKWMSNYILGLLYNYINNCWGWQLWQQSLTQCEIGVTHLHCMAAQWLEYTDPFVN